MLCDDDDDDDDVCFVVVLMFRVVSLGAEGERAAQTNFIVDRRIPHIHRDSEDSYPDLRNFSMIFWGK